MPTQELDWWSPDKVQLLPDSLKQIEQGMTEHRFLDGLITRLFYNQGTIGNLSTTWGASSPQVPTPILRSLESLSQANALRAVIETAASMLVRDPDYRVQTTGSTWKVQRSARKLGQWLTGLNRKNRLVETTYQVFIDECTNRVGGFKPFVANNKIEVERCRPDTLVYIDHEGPYALTMGQHHGIPRARVKALYGLTEEQAKDLPKYTPDPAYLVSWANSWIDFDLVEIFEGWHCSAGSGDRGWHAVVAGNGQLLFEEPWEHDWPGIILTRWSGSYAGVSGTPLGEQLIPYQLQLQRMDRTITDAISKLAIGRVWLQHIGAIPGQVAQGQAVTPALTDVPAGTHYYRGNQPPIIQPGIAMGREYYDRRQLLRAEMFELAGVSISQASGSKEVGLNSGIAQREANEKAFARLMMQAKTIDIALERVAYAEVALAKKHFEKGSHIVAAPGTRLLRQIDWKSIDVQEMGEYEIQARTMRSLPNHPSARAEVIQEWIKNGHVPPNRFIRLMGARDLEDLEDRASIAEELADQQISLAIDEGKYVAPEPYQGAALEYLVEEGQIQYLKARFTEGAPEEHLECLRRVIESARQMVKANAPAPALPPAPPGLPPALPGEVPPDVPPMPPDVAAAAM